MPGTKTQSEKHHADQNPFLAGTAAWQVKKGRKKTDPPKVNAIEVSDTKKRPVPRFELALQKSLVEQQQASSYKDLTAEEIYEEKKSDRGTPYKAYCFHGALGSFPFDAIGHRITTGKDEFKKALVLTTDRIPATSYRQAKKLAQKLGVQTGYTCKTEHPQAADLFNRIRTASSVGKVDPQYEDLGASREDVVDNQILFYDNSSFNKSRRRTINTARTNAHKKALEIFEQVIDGERPDDKKEGRAFDREVKNFKDNLAHQFSNGCKFPVLGTGQVLHRLFREKADLAEQITAELNSFSETWNSAIEAGVAEFIEAENLAGTDQIYLDSAQEFKTINGYKFFQELIRQLEAKLDGDELKVGAVANFDYAHDKRTLADVFGRPRYLKEVDDLRAQRLVPQLRVIPKLSSELKGNKVQALAARTKNPSFNNKLVEYISTEANRGQKRIVTRTHSNAATEKLVEALERKNDGKRSGHKISYAWIGVDKSDSEDSTYTMGYVDANGITHYCKQASELLAQWGHGFNTLIHASQFDQMQEPADSLITAELIKSSEQLERIASPLFTINSGKEDENRLIFVKFGADGEQNPMKLLDEAKSRHRSQGRAQRVLKSSGSSSSESTGSSSSAIPIDEEVLFYELWSHTPPRLQNNWTKIFGSQQKLWGYVGQYVDSIDTSGDLATDPEARVKEREYVWNFINEIPNYTSPRYEHDKRKIIEFIFEKAGKKISDYVGVFANFLGIETVKEAEARVYAHLDHTNYHPGKNKSQVLNDMRELCEIKSGNTFAYREPFSRLIAEFLFQDEHRELLTTQTTTETAYRDDSIQRTLEVLSCINPDKMKAGKPNTDETKLQEAFTKFIATKAQAKRLEKANTPLGITRERAADLIGEYTIEFETDLWSNGREADLEARTNELLDDFVELRAPASVDPDTFYNFLISTSVKDPHKGTFTRANVFALNPYLLEVTNLAEAQAVVASQEPRLEAPRSTVRTNWFEKISKLETRQNLIAQYIYEKHKDLLEEDNQARLKEVETVLNGTVASTNAENQDLFRDFISFAYSHARPELAKLIPAAKSKSLELTTQMAVRDNPGLAGVKTKDDFRHIAKAIISKAFDREEQRLQRSAAGKSVKGNREAVVIEELMGSLSFAEIAKQLGLSGREAIDVYFPDGMQANYEKSYQAIHKYLEESNPIYQAELPKLEELWRNTWQDNEILDNLATAWLYTEVAAELGKIKDIPDINCDAARKEKSHMMLMTTNNLRFGRKLDVPADSMSFPPGETKPEYLCSWYCESTLDQDSAAQNEAWFQNYNDIWQQSYKMYEGLSAEAVEKVRSAKANNSGAIPADLADTVFAEHDSIAVIDLTSDGEPSISLQSRGDLEQRYGIGNAGGSAAKADKLEKMFASLRQTLLSELNTDLNGLFSDFKDFLESSYYNKTLQKDLPAAIAIRDFLRVITTNLAKSIGGSPKSRPETTPEKFQPLLTAFINFLTAKRQDPTLAPRLIKRLQKQKNTDYYNNFSSTLELLMKQRNLLAATNRLGDESVFASTAKSITEECGGIVPYDFAEELEKVCDSVESKLGDTIAPMLVERIRQSWSSLASMGFLFNLIPSGREIATAAPELAAAMPALFSTDLKPIMEFESSTGVKCEIEIDKYDCRSPEIVIRYEGREIDRIN